MNEFYHYSGYLLACRRLVWPTNPPLFLIRKVIAIELALICPPLSLPSSLKRALSRNQSRRLAPSLAPSSPLLPQADRRRSRRNSRASVISGICASAFPRPAHWFRPFKSSVRPRKRVLHRDPKFKWKEKPTYSIL